MTLAGGRRGPSSLRTRLFAATATLVVLSVGVTLGIGVVLTRSAVERAHLEDLSHQADLLATRERAALLINLKPVRPVLAKQEIQVKLILRLGRHSPLLSDQDRAAVRAGRPIDGRITLDEKGYFFAARLVQQKGFVLLRPRSVRAADLRPFLQALLLAGIVGASLAGLASLLIARAIARPVRRVAEASRSLAAGTAPEPLPAEGSAELVSLSRSFNEMAAQLAHAREAEQAFLLSVSHELKTPLTAIRGYSEALREGVVSLEEAADTIGREAARLERLVRDLLDLARMNRSEFTVAREPVELGEVAQEAARRYEPVAREYEVVLEATAEGATPALADFDRVLQIVSNLVENAVRSTPAGGSVRVAAHPGSIVVSDTGRGLPAEDLARAFERFFLYDRHGGGRKLGTGLGLAIVKELTEAMGGSVEIESAPERGTTFVVRLPTPPTSVEEPDPESSLVRA